MKAAVFYGKHDLRIEDCPIPQPNSNQVQIKVHSCGICGTDLHIFEGDEGAAKSPAGTILGHEFSGEIVEYDEIKRVMSELTGRQMIISLRLYVPDTKIYVGQQTAQYAFYSLNSLPGYPEKYEKGGVFWETTQTVKLSVYPPTQVISCAIAVRSMNSFDQLAGVLFADIDVSQFGEIFSAGMESDEEMYLMDNSGMILAHKDSAHIGEGAVTAEELSKIEGQGSGYHIGDNEILVFCRLEMTGWYLITRVERTRVYTIDTSVENAMLHGILHCEKSELSLVIRSWNDDGILSIEIEDNGCGMPAELAASLAQSEIGADKHYGIANVHKRLNIFASGKCGFFIRSHEGIGTCVTIELPVSLQPNGC